MYMKKAACLEGAESLELGLESECRLRTAGVWYAGSVQSIMTVLIKCKVSYGVELTAVLHGSWKLEAAVRGKVQESSGNIQLGRRKKM